MIVFQPSDLDLSPMTFKLIQHIVNVKPFTKFWVGTSNSSAGKSANGHTHTQTQMGPILYLAGIHPTKPSLGKTPARKCNL